MKLNSWPGSAAERATKKLNKKKAKGLQQSSGIAMDLPANPSVHLIGLESRKSCGFFFFKVQKLTEYCTIGFGLMSVVKTIDFDG